VHVVAVDSGAQRSLDAAPIHADVEVDRGRAGEQAVEMAVEVGEDPGWRRMPSQMPSPTRKPESNTEIFASSRGKNSPLM